MAAHSPIETEVDALYGLALGEFTAARNALAKALRKAKRADHAAQVAKLPKPTAAAWALNQTVRRRPDLVQALSRAGETLRRVQAQVLAGQADGSALPLASEARRAAVRTVVRAMSETLDAREAQRTDEWVRTLEAASVDAALGALLVRGRFTTVVLEGVGFDGLLTGADPMPRGLRLVPPLGAESEPALGHDVVPVEDRADPKGQSTRGELALDRDERPQAEELAAAQHAADQRVEALAAARRAEELAATNRAAAERRAVLERARQNRIDRATQLEAEARSTLELAVARGVESIQARLDTQRDVEEVEAVVARLRQLLVDNLEAEGVASQAEDEAQRALGNALQALEMAARPDPPGPDEPPRE